MALNNTYFETKGRDITTPIPETPSYVPPVVPTPATPDPGSVPVIPRPTFVGNVSVSLYNNESEPNRVDKSITLILSDNIDIEGDCSLFTPVIYINTSTDLTNVNYMKIGDRYYYATVTLLSGNLYMISGKSDGLMTFASGIRSNTALVSRCQSSFNRYLPDGKVKLNAYEQVKCLEFPTGFSKTLNYYLITIGGAS